MWISWQTRARSVGAAAGGAGSAVARAVASPKPGSGTNSRSKPSTPRQNVLLTGLPGREGFLFHDGHNQPIHQAAPGLLGLLEGRAVIQRWKPSIVRWMDDAGHFFNHILHEFDGEPSWEPIRRDVEDIRSLDASPAVRSRFLFRYLTAVAGGLEHASVPATYRLVPDDSSGSVPAALSLNGPWTAYYRTGHGKYASRQVQLPVNWELLTEIENYAGSMRFTTAVHVPTGLEGRRIALAFAGVDYFADLWVNGHHVGGHEGFFAPFELDVSPYVRLGEANVLRLTVTSPNDPAGPGTHVASGWNDFVFSFPNRKSLPKGTLGHHDAKRGGAWNSMTSQDGNTGGVWNDVALRVRNPVHLDASWTRITTLSLTPAGQSHNFHARVQMSFVVENATRRRVPARLNVRVEPANFSGKTYRLSTAVDLRPGANEVKLDRELRSVRAWQPWDHGFPHLYTVRANVEVDGIVEDEAAVETGFRSLAVTPIGESPGPSGSFVINGHPIFARGTNLLPTYWLSEYTDERIARDFRMLREAGFNAVLVHALVAPQRFYTHANRHGFLVVQIFPLQWSYDETPEFVERATRQVRDMAQFLYNDPSVVSYELHNEPDMRTGEGLDNRCFDFDLHAAIRQADPHRWATTFSGGNHAYPGQFYPLRDDNSFATLPARFEHDEFDGRRISRHRNMPTEFGIQAMPHVELFRELVSEGRVRKVLERLRTDPRWVASGGTSWSATSATLDAIKATLGDGSWERALDALDWTHLRKLDGLAGEISHFRRARELDERDRERAVLARQLGLLLLDVVHYGAFKGESFWFGNWKPARTLEAFVDASQNRQYRLHKDAVETYLNAGVAGLVVGYFSFMFRDADWQAPTWGVVDAAWVPKKAYRAYVESNQPVRVSLPQALRTPVKLPGDPLFAAREERARPAKEPWVDSEIIVANDTSQTIRGAQLAIWLETERGAEVPLGGGSSQQQGAYRLSVDLAPRTRFDYFASAPDARDLAPPSALRVPDDLPAGTYHLKAAISTRHGETLSTNNYELVVLDTTFRFLHHLSAGQLTHLLDGAPGRAGFHYWARGQVAHAAKPGVRGLVAGFRHAQESGVDVYEVIQGEHLFAHILGELDAQPAAAPLVDVIWTIRSETVSPSEKSAVLVRYLEALVDRAAELLDRARQNPRLVPVEPGAHATPALRRGGTRRRTRAPRAVGRDITTGGTKASAERKEPSP